MSIIGSNILAGASGQGGGYTIENSLRLRQSASAYLNRTAGVSPTSNQKGTFSFWFKRGLLGFGTEQWPFSAGAGSMGCYIPTTDRLSFEYCGGSYLVTTQVFRDPSAWYHIVFAVDTTQATASNRAKIYVNGVQVTSFATEQYPSQNTTFNWAASGQVCYINQIYVGGRYFDGYMAEFNYIDGQALTPSDFGNYNEDTGVWQPAKYTGTYGTNGFYLPFSDNTNTTTLVADSSGNGNDWTPNNISLTSGVTYDSMTDTPTPYEDGGNYAVLNPLYPSSTPVDGNLNIVGNSTNGTVAGTMSASTGKWYAEGVFTSGFATNGWFFVWDTSTPYVPGNLPATTGQTGAYYPGITGNIVKAITGTATAVGTYSTWTNNDIIGMAFDADAGTISFYKNNTLITTFTDSGFIGRPLTFGIYYYAGNASINFGQRPFAYTPPAGFLPLHTGNLPDSAIVDGSQYFNAVTYTGNTVQDRAITGVGFDPDLTWIKNRSNGGSHVLMNVLSGGDKQLFSNLTNAEQTNNDITNGFTSDGFILGDNVSGTGSTNQNGNTYVSWNWKANGAGVSNTDGSITSTVSANPTAGFSIVTYTGTGAAATVGHGLGAAPSMVIVKSRANATGWVVGHALLNNGTNPWQYYLSLELTGAQGTTSLTWNNTAPTSSVFSLGSGSGTNPSATMVAYCFADVEGYSKFGSYTGNGSTDGTFVHLGFRPAWIMIKRTDTSGYYWWIVDTARNTYNALEYAVYAQASDAETTGWYTDSLANGFKIRGSGAHMNTNGGTYIYMAFAENPFKNSLAR